jgi:hypothetical protein
MDQVSVFKTKNNFDLTRIKSTLETSSIVYSVRSNNPAAILDGAFKTSDLPSLGDEYEVLVPSDQAEHAKVLIQSTVEGMESDSVDESIQKELTQNYEASEETPFVSMSDRVQAELERSSKSKLQVYKLVVLTLASFFIIPAFFAIPYLNRTKLLKPWVKGIIAGLIALNALGSLVLFILVSQSRLMIISIAVPLVAMIASLKSIGLASRGEKVGAFLLLIPLVILLVLALFTNFWVEIQSLLM